MFEKAVEDTDKVSTGVIEEVRGIDLGTVLVDVTKREEPEEKYNLCILIYVRPDVDPAKINPCLKNTCARLFGANQNWEHFETFYRPKNSVEVATGEKGAFNCFDITIKYPKSRFFNVQGLKSVFAAELKTHLDKAKIC